MMHPIEKLYRAAQEEVVLLRRSRPTILEATGPDSFDFLNRMSTNDLLPGKGENVRNSVFTNANARIIEIATVIPGAKAVLLLCWHEDSSPLLEWLSGYIFFQDQVRLSESTSPWELYDFIGPEARDEIAKYGHMKDDPGEGLYSFEDHVVWYEPLGALPRYRVLCRGSLADEISSCRHGFSHPVQDKAFAELLRIEAGQPGMGSEITGATIPLEVGLRDHISFSKGCYIGQEIIARMESQRKLARTLVGVQSDFELKAGDSLRTGKRKIGVITSTTHSPRHGWIGLASVKPGSWDTEVSISSGEPGEEIHIRQLPFN